MSMEGHKYVEEVAEIIQEAHRIVADADGHDIDRLTLASAKRLVTIIDGLIAKDVAALGDQYYSRKNRLLTGAP